MSNLRQMIISHISERKEIWTKLLTTTYILTQLDRIGQMGINERKGVPGLWGHSYVRTYYNWAGTPPSSAAQMEGGIATSYFVLKNLNRYLQRLDTKLAPNIRRDLSIFFINRTKPSGVGIQTTSLRSTQEVAVNLRHTCFGYLIMREIEPLDESRAEFVNAIKTAASFILRPISQDELIGSLIDESWPIGGIAAYIAAREHLFRSHYGRQWAVEEKRVWPGVKRRLIDAVIKLDSKRLNIISNSLGSKNQKDEEWLTEHFPFWHPINGLSVLRLHSTIGCISLIGRDLANKPAGQARIRNIIHDLRRQVLDSPDKAPRFASDSTGPPSVAAACAMLEILLGPWIEPTAEDAELIFTILTFLENRWDDHSVYTDYWTEFTAPLLDLEELHMGLGSHSGLAYTEGNKILDEVNKHQSNAGSSSIESEVVPDLATLTKIIPIALGNRSIYAI